MKNIYGVDWLSLEDESDFDLIDVSMMDNGDWEYTRCGVGMIDGRVFMVDLDDNGEVWSEIGWCDNVKSVEELLEVGVRYKVFDLIDWGYDEEDRYRWNVEEEVDMDGFYREVGWKGEGKLYCEYEE